MIVIGLGEWICQQLRSNMINGMGESEIAKEFRDSLKKSGIFDDRPNPFLNITPEMVETAANYPIRQSTEDPCPDFIGEQKKNEDRWDPKNWGL